MITRVANIVAAVLICIAMCPGTPARALTPPVVDGSRLHAPAPPGPPQPTTQRAGCIGGSELAPDRSAASPLPVADLEALWRVSRGDGQRVAVIDTGVNRHPRLAQVEPGGDYVSAGDGTQDCDGHGTVVAGLIAAAPDPADPSGFAGIAPAATVLAIRQSTVKFGPAADPAETGFGDVDTMARAVRTAADLGATVINISSVACATGPLDDAPLGAALAYAVDVKDVVVVTAAGNVGGAGQCPHQQRSAETDWDSTTVAVSPAWYDDYVLTVGSVDAHSAPSPFTLAGPWVDVAAPGENLTSLDPAGSGTVSTLPGLGGPAPISGTSYAAPIVSGLAALIRSAFPRLTARQVMRRIESTTRPPHRGRDPLLGHGVVDLTAALGPDGPDAPSEPVARPDRPDGSARMTAMIGAGVCGIGLALALAARSSAARVRRSEDR